MASIRAKIRDHTDRRFAGRELHHVVADLNPVLRGWGAYFRYGNSNRKFAAIDSYVHLRMSKLASVKYATRGRLRASRFNYGWLTELGVYRLTGTCPEMGTCACLTMNGVGKPCAGEPHARFDRGPLGRLTPRRDGTHAPNGKPAGLSPSAAPATPNQRPTSPLCRTILRSENGSVKARDDGSLRTRKTPHHQSRTPEEEDRIWMTRPCSPNSYRPPSA